MDNTHTISLHPFFSLMGAVALLATLGCDTSPEPVDAPAQDTAELARWSGEGFRAEGAWMSVIEDAPVELRYDPDAQLMRVDVLATAPMTLLLDWEEESAGSYLIADGRCFRGPLPRAEMPAVGELIEAMPESLEDFRRDGSEPIALLASAGSPDHLVLDTSQLFMMLRLDSVGELGDPSSSELDEDDDLGELMALCAEPESVEDVFGSKPLRGDADPADGVPRSGSWIQTNGYFVTSDTSYVGQAFQTDKSTYNSNYDTCWSSSECRANLTLEGGFRYGYHCGAGWGTGQTFYLDPVDAVCRYHDGRYWGTSDRENWCGMAAALSCRSDSDWFWDIWFLEFFHASVARDSISTFATSACIANGGNPLSTICY